MNVAAGICVTFGMNKLRTSLIIPLLIFSPWLINAQHHDHPGDRNRKLINIEPQPLLSHAIRVSEALNFAGSALSDTDQKKLKHLQRQKPSAQIIQEVQQILDPYCIAYVDINPEARVKVEKGPAEARLTQGGWTI